MQKFWSRVGAGAAVATMALLGTAPAHAQKTLRAAMHSDLKIVDPIWTTALISLDHAYMIYDTLFALDEKLQVQPQMIDRYEVSADKLTWTFTLRDGLEWHDGTPVTAADCVPSLKRWGARDSMGQKLMSFVAGIDAIDAKTFQQVRHDLRGKGRVAQPVASAVQPHDQTVTDQIVAAHPVEFHQILDADRPGHGIGGQRQDQGGRHQQSTLHR